MCFHAAQNQSGKLTNSNAAGTVQEECSSPPSALRVSLLGEDTTGALPLGRPGVPAGSCEEGSFPRVWRRFDPFAFPPAPLPAYGCHPCLRSPSLDSPAAARALAGGGGKTSLLLGWKQVLLAPQLTTQFLPFVGAVRITPSIHPTGQEQENSVLVLLRANKKKYQPRNICRPPYRTWHGQCHRARRDTAFTRALDSCMVQVFVTAAAQR